MKNSNSASNMGTVAWVNFKDPPGKHVPIWKKKKLEKINWRVFQELDEPQEVFQVWHGMNRRKEQEHTS